MSNDTENISMSAEEGRSPCVRAFVANFERRDSNAGVGNENRPPVMTKSKVSLLRQTLGKTSDSVKSASSDSESSSKIHEAGDSGATDDSSEHVISVAKLKENLQKSASEKPIAPWAFGGAGRPVKEPRKKPTPKHRNDAEAEVEAKSSRIDNPPNGSDRPKRKLNNSYKQSQENLIESPAGTESLDENVFFGNSVVFSAVSNQNKSFQGQLSRSSSSDNQTGEKHKLAPKVLPKPVPRKSKAKLVNVSHERSQSDDKLERTAYQNKNTTLDSSSSNLTMNRKPGSNETLLETSTSSIRSDSSEVFRPETSKAVICSEEHVNLPPEMHQTENTSMNVTGEEVHNSTDMPHDVDPAHAKTTEDRDILHADNHVETSDEDLVHTTDASSAVPPVAARTRCTNSTEDENSDDNRETDDAVIVKRSITEGNDEHILPESLSDHRISSEVTSVEQNDRASSSVSSEHMTDLVISDDESLVDANKCSKMDDESSLPSVENNTRSQDEDVMHRTESISLAQDFTQAHNNLAENGDTIESAASECDDSTENSRFLHCMGPDFITDIKELSSITAEEQEYEALATVVCCKMLEQEEENVSWLLCPPETYRSTMDYVSSLFQDDILVGIGERKFGTWDIEESSFMSSDSLRESLLDKASKKLECLKLQKQKLEAAARKQVELEELLDAVVKEKVDSRQYSKYRSTLEEFDQVTHLLLMLSSRLANTDNSLDQISFSDQEQQKVQLILKRDNLIEKFKEARSIKESSETRRRQMAECLQQRLKATEFFDYRQLVKTKCQLKIVRHSLEDRVSLSEEQIKILVAIIEKNTCARYC